MDRGQAHTLEAFTAALLLVSGVIFALQATAITPLSASTSNQHIQNQQRLLADDILASAADNGTLAEAVLYWNRSESGFHGAGDTGYYTSGGPPTDFGRMLNQTFQSDRIAFNVFVYFTDDSGDAKRQTMVFMGSPSDNAVTATRTVTLYDDTALTWPGATGNVSSAAAADEYFAPDGLAGSALFQVMEVRIVVWRM